MRRSAPFVSTFLEDVQEGWSRPRGDPQAKARLPRQEGALRAE